MKPFSIQFNPYKFENRNNKKGLKSTLKIYKSTLTTCYQPVNKMFT